MTTLTFVRVYPNNTPGNRLVIDTASFSDSNRANEFKFQHIKQMKRLKASYFVSDGKSAIYSLWPAEKLIIETEAAEILAPLIYCKEV